MGDAVKWAMLGVAAVALIALIMALPFVQFANAGELGSAIQNIVAICEDAFTFGRGLINNFLTPFGRTIVSGLIVWLLAKWALMIAIKTAAWTYHFVFK